MSQFNIRQVLTAPYGADWAVDEINHLGHSTIALCYTLDDAERIVMALQAVGGRAPAQGNSGAFGEVNQPNLELPVVDLGRDMGAGQPS